MANEVPPNLSITAYCQSCGAQHAFDPSVVGKKARCQTCGFIFNVPDIAPDEPEVVSAFCQSCGTKQTFDVRLVHKKVECESCGYVFTVPDTRPPGAPGKSIQGGKSRQPRTVRKPRQLPGAHTLDDPYISLDNKRVEEQLLGMSDPVPVPAEEDPLRELASNERTSSGDSGPQAPAVAHSGEETVIGEPSRDPQASATVLSIMLAMVFVTLMIIVVIVLEYLVGIVLTLWILLPAVIVYGMKVLSHLVFLLTGKPISKPG